jgi:(S)-sulfolactate dehydrogenase
MTPAADIVITEFIDDAALASLRRDFAVHYDPKLAAKPAEIVRLAAASRGLIVRNVTQVRGALLEGLEALRVVGRLGVGLDNIDVEACRARGILVYPATGANTVSVAEYVIAAILHGLRGGIWRVTDKVMAGWWERTSLLLGEAAGKRLGLIGFGAIARAVARRAAALDMVVVASDPVVPPNDPAWRELGATRVDLAELLAECDVVSLHVPLTDATRNMIDAGALAAMKPTAGIINTSRGGVIDETALAAALAAGKLGFAVLDVFEREPPGGSPLAGVPNLIATPHIAGNTVESNVRVSQVTVDNVRRALKSV